MVSSTGTDKLVGVVDAEYKLVHAEDRLRRLIGWEPASHGSFLDAFPASSHPLIQLAARRLVPEVTLPIEARGETLVARGAAVGDETWLLLFVRPFQGPNRSSQGGLVGRRSELVEFDRYLGAAVDEDVLYVQGPLGIGKTSLLSAFRLRCQELGCRHFTLNARNVPPTEDAVIDALCRMGGPLGRLARFDAIAELVQNRWVLFIDDVDAWSGDMGAGGRSYDAFPSKWRIVVASRRPPDPTCWGRSVRIPRVLTLGVLDPSDATELAAELGVPRAQANDIAQRAGRHPSSIVAFAAALRTGVPLAATSPPLELVLEKEGSRSLLDASSIPARITEDVLAALLGDGDVATAYDTLASLCTRDESGIGLRLPVVIREALLQRSEARNPRQHAELRRRLVSYVASQLEHEVTPSPGCLVDDLLDSFNDRPSVRRLAGEQANLLPPVHEARPQDRAELARMLRGLEPAERRNAILERFDLDIAVTKFAGDRTAIEGLCQHVIVTAADLAHSVVGDESLAAAVDVLRGRLTLTGDEYAVAFVTWWGRDIEQVGWGLPSQALFRSSFPMLLTQPMPAAVVVVSPDDSFPLPLPRREMPIRAGNSYAHFFDLRGRDTVSRLASVLAPTIRSIPSRRRFDGLSDGRVTRELVREALGLAESPSRLLASPLIALRSLSARAGPQATPNERAQALAGLLRELVGSLAGGERENKQREALMAAFFERTGKHEKIASDLGMPYGSFRRYVAQGTVRVAELLRAHEDKARRRSSRDHR